MGLRSHAADGVRAVAAVCWTDSDPQNIRLDQGSEFFSRAPDRCTYALGVTLDFSGLGRPNNNAFIETLKSELRGECPLAHWFKSLEGR